MVWVSIETIVVWGRVNTGVVWTSTWAVWISVWVSTETKATLLEGGGWFLWLAVCSVWSPRYDDREGGQEGAEGFTLKSIPLGHKSGIPPREKKGNTYATSSHFPCFLQNLPNCKIIIIEILQQVSIPHLLNDTVAIQYHRRRSGVPSLSSGDQIYPSFSEYSSKEWGWNC